MKKLYFSQQDMVLYWICGYCQSDLTDKVLTKIGHLKKNAEKLAKIANVPTERIDTLYIEKSEGYAKMRVYYILDFEGELPKETDILKSRANFTEYLD